MRLSTSVSVAALAVYVAPVHAFEGNVFSEQNLRWPFFIIDTYVIDTVRNVVFCCVWLGGWGAMMVGGGLRP